MLKPWFIVLAVLLPVALTSSSFDAINYLVRHAINGALTSQQQVRLLSYDRHTILAHYHIGSAEWLRLNQLLAQDNPVAAFALFAYYQSTQPKSASLWLQQAVKLNYLPAVETVANQWLQAEQYQQILRHLTIPKVSSRRLKQIYAEALIATGQLSALAQFVQVNLAELDSQFIADLDEFNLLPSTELQARLQCDYPVQWFATTYADLQSVSAIIQQLKQQPILTKRFCFAAPRFIARHQLACQSSETHQRRHCDEASFGQQSLASEVVYLAVMLPETKAYTHRGIIYIDRRDTLATTVHEFTHLLGFVDEYPLPANHGFCQAEQAFDSELKLAAPNILITRTGNKPLIIDGLNRVEQSWQQYWFATATNDREVEDGTAASVFASMTCQKGDVFAWKPQKTLSGMQYAEMGFNDLYVELANSPLVEQFSMPSYHYNIALALIEQGKGAAGQAWLKKAIANEQSLAKQQQLKALLR